MVAIIFLVIYCIVLLTIYLNPKTKKWLYPRDSLKHFEDAINEFDKNKKAIEDLDLSDYKLGDGHIYT